MVLRRDQQPVETERQDLDRRALLSLSLARLPDGAERATKFEDFQLMEVGESLRVLAAGRNQVGSALRPAIIRRLIGLAGIGADAVGDIGADINALHRSLAEEAGVPDVDLAVARLDQHLVELSVALVTGPDIPIGPMVIDRESRINPADLRVDRSRFKINPADFRVNTALIKVDVGRIRLDDSIRFHRAPAPPPGGEAPVLAATGPRRPDPPEAPEPDAPPSEAQVYAATVAETLGLPQETVGPPACEDETAITWNGHQGYLVQSAWWTKMTVAELRPWLEPRNWPKCSHKTFFKSMKEVAQSYDHGPYARAGTAKFKGRSWSVAYDETVKLDKLITTRLRFEHFEEGALGAPADSPVTCMWTEYQLEDPDKPGELLIDHGIISVEAVECNGGPLSKVVMTKNFGFASAKYRDWPTLACDTFFGEAAMMMASNCQKA